MDSLQAPKLKPLNCHLCRKAHRRRQTTRLRRRISRSGSLSAFARCASSPWSSASSSLSFTKYGRTAASEWRKKHSSNCGLADHGKRKSVRQTPDSASPGKALARASALDQGTVLSAEVVTIRTACTTWCRLCPRCLRRARTSSTQQSALLCLARCARAT